MKTDAIGEISLSRLAANVNLSHSWVKKIEERLNLPPWGSGTRGKKSYYTMEQQELFRKIAVLRRLGFGLDVIKDLYDLEKEIMKFAEKHFPSNSGTKKVRYISLYLIVNVFCGSFGVEYDRSKYDVNKEVAAKLKEMYDTYSGIIGMVTDRLDSYHKELGAEREQLIGVVGEGKR
jgi:DNA-binding transcriptional MerR regulator